ncbi:putative endonuclease and reverse transcriptase-like protein [Operophtera brumata]|uniref:Putative endonuclease and reverse transcriptase-like protein n=1 Tax=Operophtera brumata TaxID=104452 RepID=A0A0L7KT03_OPEBR|nr:putative endonuclease and reverse transcriptase-like protein [Operophtera brumata]
MRALGVEVCTDGHPLQIYAVYKLPGEKLGAADLAKLLRASPSAVIIVAGDWNCEHPSWNANISNPDGGRLRRQADTRGYDKHVGRLVGMVRGAHAKLLPILHSNLPLRTKILIYKIRLKYVAPAWYPFLKKSNRITKEMPLTCANCDGAHTANNKSCPARNKRAGTAAITTSTITHRDRSRSGAKPPAATTPTPTQARLEAAGVSLMAPANPPTSRSDPVPKRKKKLKKRPNRETDFDSDAPVLARTLQTAPRNETPAAAPSSPAPPAQGHPMTRGRNPRPPLPQSTRPSAHQHHEYDSTPDRPPE